MVKRFFLIVCIFLVCLSFVRIAMGVEEPIKTYELASYIANNSGTAQTIQEATKEFSRLMEQFDGVLSIVKLDEAEAFLRSVTDENDVGDTIFELLAFLVGFFEGVVMLVVASLLLGVVAIQYGLPLLLGALKDIVLVFRIIMTLLFGIGVPI